MTKTVSRNARGCSGADATDRLVHPAGRLTGMLLLLASRMAAAATSNALCVVYVYRGYNANVPTDAMNGGNALGALSHYLAVETGNAAWDNGSIFIPLNIKMAALEPITMYTSAGSGAVCDAQCYLYFE